MPSLYYEIFNNNKNFSPILFCCDHASNFVPKEFNNLGVQNYLLKSHIAYDIGARSLTLELAKLINTSAILGKYSRLLVDLNRSPSHHNIIPKSSDKANIPLNANLTQSDSQYRITKYHLPYHKALDIKLKMMDKKFKCKTSLICIHSFTPSLKGKKLRPWHIGLLHRDDLRLVQPISNYLKIHKKLKVANNVPYSGYDKINYTMTKHGELDERPFISIEIRNDLIKNKYSHSFRWITNLLVDALLRSQSEIEKNIKKNS